MDAYDPVDELIDETAIPNREWVKGEVARLLTESQHLTRAGNNVYVDVLMPDGALNLAERILTFLDSIGYDSSHELENED